MTESVPTYEWKKIGTVGVDTGEISLDDSTSDVISKSSLLLSSVGKKLPAISLSLICHRM